MSYSLKPTVIRIKAPNNATPKYEYLSILVSKTLTTSKVVDTDSLLFPCIGVTVTMYISPDAR